jgi:hypothetical protein
MRLAFTCFALVVAACGSPTKPTIQIEPPPPPATRAMLAGPSCSGQACTCRDEGAPEDGGAGVPDSEMHKRFEFRLGPTENDLWVIVDEHVLYKSKERVTECFYLDLTSGQHKVTLRASKPHGLQASMAISELGTKTKSWYETFRFRCGVPGVCAHSHLDELKVAYDKIPRGIHDECGSVKVQSLMWDTGVAPDQIHPQDLVVGLVLDVYRFPPKFPHGDAKCGKGSGRDRGDGPEPEPEPGPDPAEEPVPEAPVP